VTASRPQSLGRRNIGQIRTHPALENAFGAEFSDIIPVVFVVMVLRGILGHKIWGLKHSPLH